MSAPNHKYTTAGIMKKPPVTQIYECVKRLWCLVKEKTSESFKK